MRAVRYNVAASLDGYIAGPHGEFDWIPVDAAVDFAALFARVDTVLLGRRSHDAVRREPAGPWPSGARVYVFSDTLAEAEVMGATLVRRERAASSVAALRAEPGNGEIWLFGGGTLFGSLLESGQVDRVEVTVVPVLLGGGVPLLPPGRSRTALELTGSHTYPSGMVTLQYRVPGAT